MMFHPANEGMSLPLRTGATTNAFNRQLRLAYERDYSFVEGEPVVLGNAPIQWSRKIAFNAG